MSFTRFIMIFLLFMVQIFLVLSKTLFLLWLCLELKMFLILSILYQSAQQQSFHLFNYRKLLVVLWYFLIQVIGSFLMLVGILSPQLLFILLLGVLLKLGFFPLFYWVVYLYESVGWLDVFVMGYMSKVGLFLVIPQLFFFCQKPSDLLVWVLGLTYMFSVIGMFVSLGKLKVMAGWSSLNNISLLLLVALLDLNLSLLLLGFYGMVFFCFCYFLATLQEEVLLAIFVRFTSHSYGSEYLLFLVVFLWFVGFPPFTIFWVKVISLLQILVSWGLWVSSFLTIIIFLQVLIYMKVYNFVVYSKLLKFFMNLRNSFPLWGLWALVVVQFLLFMV